MDQRREKDGVVVPRHSIDTHIYTTHRLKLGEDKKREWLFLVIYTFHMHIYTTHQLKLGIDQRREKEGVVIPSHLYIWHAHLHNSLAKVENESEKRKRRSGYS